MPCLIPSRRTCILALALLPYATVTQAPADPWRSPSTQEYRSNNGHYALRTDPGVRENRDSPGERFTQSRSLLCESF